MGAGLFHLFASTKEKHPAPGTGEIAKARLKKMLNADSDEKKPGENPGREKRHNRDEALTQGKKHDKTIQIKRL